MRKQQVLEEIRADAFAHALEADDSLRHYSSLDPGFRVCTRMIEYELEVAAACDAILGSHPVGIRLIQAMMLIRKEYGLGLAQLKEIYDAYDPS